MTALLPMNLRKYKRQGVVNSELNKILKEYDLPSSVQELYKTTNGFKIPKIDTEILSLAKAIDYAKKINKYEVAYYYKLFPFTESNNSNPYCIILGEKFNGAILLLNHDDRVYVTHESISSFLTSISNYIKNNDDDYLLIEYLTCDPANNEPFQDDAETIVSENLPLENKDPGLAGDHIIPIMSYCKPQTLIKLLEFNYMWIREEAAIQLAKTNCLEAIPHLEKLANSGNRQDNNAAKKTLSILNRKNSKDNQ